LLPLLNKFIDDADIRDKVFFDKQIDKRWDYGVKALITLAAILGVKIAYTYFQEKL